MHKKILFRCMDHSDAIEKYIYKKIEKIDKFFKREPSPIYIDMILQSHKRKELVQVEFRVHSAHYNIIIRTEGYDIYAMIDEAVHRMIKDMTRRKDKMGHPLYLSYV